MAESKKISEIRVRFPPSPTGFLHVGNARTAIFNWLFAKHNSGKFILRIEDTDTERSKKEYEDDIIWGLKWLALEWDEFYKQSDRTPIYSKYLQKLLAEKKAFWCYHSEEELEKERQEQLANKVIPRHVCKYKYQTSNIKYQNDKSRIKNKEEGVIRLAVNENSTRKIEFEDLIRGHIEFEERLLGDFSIARNLDAPLYHFAVVVDDYEMEISHIIRGEDHIANTPKQILIQEALGFERPQYAHLPLLLGPDKSKLSKRHGAVSLSEYKKQGYLSEAVFNFLALLGFTPPESKEIFSRDELIEIFDLARVHKSGAIFNIQKLDWMNGEYIKNLPDERLAEKIFEIPNDKFQMTKEGLVKIMPLARERMKKLSDILEFSYFFKEPEYDRGLLLWKDRSFEEIKNSLLEVAKIIEERGTDDKNVLRQELDFLGAKLGDRGLVYWPFRAALTGRRASPDPVDIAEILGKQKTLERVKRAIENLG